MNPQGKDWVETTLHRLADELGLDIERLEWVEDLEDEPEHKSSGRDALHSRLVVVGDGESKVRRLSDNDAEDAPKTPEVAVKLEHELRRFLESFGQSSSKIGFGHPKQP